MIKQAAVILLALPTVAQLSAHERYVLARFDGGIGVVPVFCTVTVKSRM